MLYKARQGKARQGKARQGKARQDKARQGKARQGYNYPVKSKIHSSIFLSKHYINNYAAKESDMPPNKKNKKSLCDY